MFEHIQIYVCIWKMTDNINDYVANLPKLVNDLPRMVEGREGEKIRRLLKNQIEFHIFNVINM